jgi:hypothetical protein
MPQKYIHFLGNESATNLLKEYGIVTADSETNNLLSEALKPKVCPNCLESNIPDCKFCSKCRMVLTYDAYEDTLEEQKKKDKRLEELEKSLQAQVQTQQNQQKILEAIWNNMAALSAADASTSSKEDNEKKKENNNNKNKNDIHVSRLSLTWQKRGGKEKEPPITTAAETFVLADGKNNKLAKDMSPEEIEQLPWRTLVSREELRWRLSSSSSL